MQPCSTGHSDHCSMRCCGERTQSTGTLQGPLLASLCRHFMQPYPRYPADYSKHLLVLAVTNVYDW